MPQTAIRLHYVTQDHDGHEVFEDAKEEYDLGDFGGVLPAVGDLIVSPWVVEGRDRRNPANRSVYEVLHRYFQPVDKSTTDLIYIILVVGERAATWKEVNIATRL